MAMAQEENAAEVLEVLFIEEDQHFADIYKLTLELDGYRVTVVSSPLQAVRRLRSHVPDLIFLDVTLPDMDAWEVLNFLRDDVRTRYVPVIILTPDDESDEFLRRGLALESHCHMLKMGRQAGRKVLVGPWLSANRISPGA
jgi:CheY-like chemotaxis protein